MQPERTLSEAGKVIAELGRQLRSEKKMSLDTLQVFIDLLKSYAKAVRTVNQPIDNSIRGPGKSSGGKISKAQVEEWSEAERIRQKGQGYEAAQGLVVVD